MFKYAAVLGLGLLVSGCVHTGFTSTAGSKQGEKVTAELIECPKLANEEAPSEKAAESVAVLRSAVTGLVTAVVPAALEFVGQTVIATLEEREDEFSETFSGRVNVDSLYKGSKGELAYCKVKLTRTVGSDDEVKTAFELTADIVVSGDKRAMKLVPDKLLYAIPKARYDDDDPVAVAVSFGMSVVSGLIEGRTEKVSKSTVANPSMMTMQLRPSEKEQVKSASETDWFVAPPIGPLTLTVTVAEEGGGKDAYTRALKAAKDLEPKVRGFIRKQLPTTE
jgi:hypothetical protein